MSVKTIVARLRERLSLFDFVVDSRNKGSVEALITVNPTTKGRVALGLRIKRDEKSELKVKLSRITVRPDIQAICRGLP
jgi:hypothetical protein